MTPIHDSSEKFEYRKGVIRNRKSKDRKYNGQKKKDEKINKCR